jgi:hypothetical protein
MPPSYLSTPLPRCAVGAAIPPSRPLAFLMRRARATGRRHTQPPQRTQSHNLALRHSRKCIRGRFRRRGRGPSRYQCRRRWFSVAASRQEQPVRKLWITFRSAHTSLLPLLRLALLLLSLLCSRCRLAALLDDARQLSVVPVAAAWCGGGGRDRGGLGVGGAHGGAARTHTAEPRSRWKAAAQRHATAQAAGAQQTQDWLGPAAAIDAASARTPAAAALSLALSEASMAESCFWPPYATAGCAAGCAEGECGREGEAGGRCCRSWARSPGGHPSRRSLVLAAQPHSVRHPAKSCHREHTAACDSTAAAMNGAASTSPRRPRPGGVPAAVAAARTLRRAVGAVCRSLRRTQLLLVFMMADVG